MFKQHDLKKRIKCLIKKKIVLNASHIWIPRFLEKLFYFKQFRKLTSPIQIWYCCKYSLHMRFNADVKEVTQKERKGNNRKICFSFIFFINIIMFTHDYERF